MLPVGFVRDDRQDAPRFQIAAPVIGVIGFVSEQVAGVWQGCAQHDSALDIGGLAGCQIESQRAAMFIAYGVDLGVAASFCAANGLSRSPPFPPPAQRWTLTCEASMETCSGVPDSAAVSSANIYCQIPFCDQRL